MDITSSCGDYVLAAVLNTVQDIIAMIQMITPILLIVALAILIVGIFANPDDKKYNKKLYNTILAALVVFLIPTVVELLLGILPSDIAGLELGACWEAAGSVTYGEYTSPSDYVGLGQEATSFRIDLSSLVNATPPSSTPSSSTNGLTTDCGTGQNLAGITNQCISGSGARAEVVNLALSYLGYPYVYGAKGQEFTPELHQQLKNENPNRSFMTEEKAQNYYGKGFLAFDCSGFISYVYQQKGYTHVSGGSTTLSELGIGTTYEKLQPGDILWKEGHVAMYVGKDSNGVNWIVHASNHNDGVKLSTTNPSEFAKYRRIINE